MKCLALPDNDDDYIDTAGNARRRVGLAILAVLRDDPSSDPLSSFEEVVANRANWFNEGLVEWIDGLSPGGLSVLAQQAISYASSIAAEIPPARLGNVAIAGPSESQGWTLPGHSLHVKGRCEALSPRGGRPPDRRLLAIRTNLENVEEVAGHIALTYTLMTASMPARVTVLAPSTGRAVVAVTDELLEAALERLGATVYAAIAAKFGPLAPTTPGQWCRRCPRLADCAEGAAYLARTPPRAGGLLLGAL